MKQAIKDLLGSKKFLVTLAAILVWGLSKAGVGVTTETILPVLGLLATFVLGQGVADMGKEAAKVEAPKDSPPD